MSKTDLVCVGAIAGAFGVQGEVRLKSFCSTPEDIALYAPLFTEDGRQSFSVKLSRSAPGGLVVRLSGVLTKEQGDAMKGVTLWAKREKLPTLPDDEFYHADLIGLEAVDTGGQPMGRVIAIHNHGAGDIIELQQAGQKAARLLPFTMAVVPTVDLHAGRIVVDPPGEVE